jgi:formylglycine-generating enzyme required for sulfatase activity
MAAMNHHPESSPAPGRSPILLIVLVGVVVGAVGWVLNAKPWQSANQSPASQPSANAQACAADGQPCQACKLPMPARFVGPVDDKDAPPGMVWIGGGDFSMGDSRGDGFEWERPVHRVRVDGFYIDKYEVTNAQFQAFVDATHYITTAEKKPDLNEIMKQLPPGTPPPPAEKLVPASLVFHKTEGPVDTSGHNWFQWWEWTPGADWKHPTGPGSDIKGKELHPVVQISWDDAVAYCKWANRRLPTEAEWEYAARGGLESKPYTWGDQPFDPKHPQANIWQGSFPWKNTMEDGYELTAPVGKFPANGYGLYDMAGNVWEWCSDWFSPETYAKDKEAKDGIAINPQGPEKSLDPDGVGVPKKAIRGGSFLCSDAYCSSYRPSARMHTSPDSATNHQGLRGVMTKATWDEIKAKRAAATKPS